jgi:hypothetical protein
MAETVPEGICPYHFAREERDWATGNRIICDFVHRGVVPAAPPRLAVAADVHDDPRHAESIDCPSIGEPLVEAPPASGARPPAGFSAERNGASADGWRVQLSRWRSFLPA